MQRDLTNEIQQAVQVLANRILEKDPTANITVNNSAVQIVQNMPFDTPLADLTIITGGTVYNYSIVFSQQLNQLTTIPFINQGE